MPAYEILLGELSRAGIILDLMGAILIGKAVFYRNNSDIINTSGANFGYSAKHTRGAIIAKREALAGCGLFMLGFIMQFFGTEYGTSNIHPVVDIAFAIIALLTVLLSIYAIKFWTNRTFEKLRLDWEKSQKP